MIQHCRKTLPSRTKENGLVIQIQKALWRKLEPLFSRNKKLHASKEVKENALALEGKSCRPETITAVNRYVSWPLSVKHAAKITFAQWKWLCRTFRSIIYPAEEKNFIGTSSILAWGKSRVGLPSPFIAPILSTFTLPTSFPSPSVAVHSKLERYLEAVNFGRRKWIWTLFYTLFLQYLANT